MPASPQIVAAIGQVGVVEPPVVARDPDERGKYLLLDGHLRIEALRDRGETHVACLISTHKEAVTYNERVNQIAIIPEHRRNLKAIERRVSEEPTPPISCAYSLSAGGKFPRLAMS